MSAVSSPLVLGKVSVLKTDLDAKSRAATAGWDAAAGAESEAAAAEARGLEAGIKRGRLDAEKKVRAAAIIALQLRFPLDFGCCKGCGMISRTRGNLDWGGKGEKGQHHAYSCISACHLHEL